jgi:hypothetical protein
MSRRKRNAGRSYGRVRRAVGVLQIVTGSTLGLPLGQPILHVPFVMGAARHPNPDGGGMDRPEQEVNA